MNDSGVSTEDGAGPSPVGAGLEIAPAAVPRQPNGADDLSVRLEQGLVALGTRLLSAIEEKVERDRFREEQVDRLHTELERQRSALSDRLVRPYLSSMIRLHDDVAGLWRALRELPDDERTAERCLDALAGLREDVEVILSHHGVEAFRGEEESFDPRRQNAVRMLTTDSTELAGVVAERLLPGFCLDDLVLQKERVVAYRFVAPAAAEPNPSKESEEENEDER